MVTLTLRVNEALSRKVLLPLANEVWGKIMFLLACVILFTGGGSWSLSHGGSLSGKRVGGTNPTGMHSC